MVPTPFEWEMVLEIRSVIHLNNLLFRGPGWLATANPFNESSISVVPRHQFYDAMCGCGFQS